MCRKLAGYLNRSPSALDKTLRNIKQAYTGGPGLPHASRAIRGIVEEFREKPVELLAEAAEARAQLGVPPLDNLN